MSWCASLAGAGEDKVFKSGAPAAISPLVLLPSSAPDAGPESHSHAPLAVGQSLKAFKQSVENWNGNDTGVRGQAKQACVAISQAVLWNRSDSRGSYAPNVPRMDKQNWLVRFLIK